jgi:hypothetical protein
MGDQVDVQLFTTLGCHLCEEAEAMIVSESSALPRALLIEAVDIADEAELVEAYGVRIPVLLRCSDDAELAWPFSASELRAFLFRAAQCQSSSA